MNTNLFKESSATSRQLGEELRHLLGELDPAVAEPLLERLSVETHPTPLLVFTGQYSSGKSTLIKALTNGAAGVAIGSGVTTNEVEEFSWDGDVRLVDTPGVHAGRPHHDELAEKALQSADLVLFAVTVELFDDVLTTHLRDVLGRLGKSRQTLIALTKGGTMPPATAGVREAALNAALGPFDEIPWAECDAQYYLQGLELRDADPDTSRAFIDASGLANLTSLINRFASQQGEVGTLSQPLQLIKALALEALAGLTDDPDERAALSVLARQRSALSKKRLHLDTLLKDRAGQFRADAVRAATTFADRIDGDESSPNAHPDVLDAHVAALNDDLRSALGRFEEAVRQLLEIQFDDLASEVLEIEASPYGRVSVRLGGADAGAFQSQEVEVRPEYVRAPSGRSPRLPSPTWAGDLSTHLDHFRTFWGAGAGVKASAGSVGHEVVLNVGHFFGKKFKPWEAVRTANTVGKVASIAGKVAKVGGMVVSIGLEAYSVFTEEREAVRAEHARAIRRRDITQEVLGQADCISADALYKIGSTLDAVFKPEFERIDAMADEIYGARAARSELRDRLISIRQRAEDALMALCAKS